MLSSCLRRCSLAQSSRRWLSAATSSSCCRKAALLSVSSRLSRCLSCTHTRTDMPLRPLSGTLAVLSVPCRLIAMPYVHRHGGLTLAKALCCWAWLVAWASSLATTLLRRAKASSAAAILSRSPTCDNADLQQLLRCVSLKLYAPDSIQRCAGV